jgi:uncharacterized integral membrane protein
VEQKYKKSTFTTFKKSLTKVRGFTMRCLKFFASLFLKVEMTGLEQIFVFSLLLALLLSFYFFINHLVMKNKKYALTFNTWQFPMLLALFIDAVYHIC